MKAVREEEIKLRAVIFVKQVGFKLGVKERELWMSRVVKQKRKKCWVKEWVSQEWRNWYQNEVDEEIKRADSRDMVKHKERSDQLFLERMMKVAEQD